MAYLERIIEDDLKKKLEASGAVLIKGPKSCGKTETAKQFAASIVEMDVNKQVPAMMETDPSLLLKGLTPRLIDEWQIYPEVWNYIKHEVDDRKEKSQFILTGSSNPNNDARMHSGAGRFTIAEMGTLTWQELGFSSGLVSLSQLLKGEEVEYFQ